MPDFTTRTLYSELGADISDSDICYDESSGIKVYVALRLHWRNTRPHLDNTTQVLVFVHHPGEPPKLHSDDTVYEHYKGEGVSICKERKGLDLLINGHSTRPEDAGPDGARLTTLETVTIPDIFPA